MSMLGLLIIIIKLIAILMNALMNIVFMDTHMQG